MRSEGYCDRSVSMYGDKTVREMKNVEINLAYSYTGQLYRVGTMVLFGILIFASSRTDRIQIAALCFWLKPTYLCMYVHTSTIGVITRKLGPICTRAHSGIAKSSTCNMYIQHGHNEL